MWVLTALKLLVKQCEVFAFFWKVMLRQCTHLDLTFCVPWVIAPKVKSLFLAQCEWKSVGQKEAQHHISPILPRTENTMNTEYINNKIYVLLFTLPSSVCNLLVFISSPQTPKNLVLTFFQLTKQNYLLFRSFFSLQICVFILCLHANNILIWWQIKSCRSSFIF